MPSRLDQDAPEMRVAGFGDRAARCLRPARVLGRNQADEGHEARCGGKTTGVAELRGDSERREIVNATETSEPLNAWAQGLEIEERPQVLLDGLQPRHRFVDRAELGVVGLVGGWR